MLEKFNFIRVVERNLSNKLEIIYNELEDKEKNKDSFSLFQSFYNYKNLKKLKTKLILKSHYNKWEKKILINFFTLDFEKFYLKYKNKFNKNEKISFEIWLVAFDYFENECYWGYCFDYTFLEVVNNIYRSLIEDNLKEWDDFTIWTSYWDIEEKIEKILNKYKFINKK